MRGRVKRSSSELVFSAQPSFLSAFAARPACALSRSGFVTRRHASISSNHGGTACMASELAARICFTICLGNGFRVLAGGAPLRVQFVILGHEPIGNGTDSILQGLPVLKAECGVQCPVEQQAPFV